MPRFVEIRHPEVEGTASVSEQAFVETWEAKGWEIVEAGPESEQVVYAESPVWAADTTSEPAPDEAETPDPVDELVPDSDDGDDPES